MRRLLISAALVALCGAAPAFAAQTAESKACSTQATAKALHGKDRETFMASCKAAAPAAAPMAAAAPAKVVKTAPMATLTPAPTAKGVAPKSDASKACSDQATAKGLHGKDRETFRTACMKGAPAPMMAAPAKPAAAPMAAAPAKPAAAAPAAPAKPSILGSMFGPKPAAPAAEATPPEPTAASSKATSTTMASGKPKTPGQIAAGERIKKCGAMWQADKAAGKTGGLKWPQYWSACNKRLKAA